MFSWIPVAMVRVTLYFALGILINIFFPAASFTILFSVLVFLFLVFILLHLLKKFPALKGIAAFLSIFIAGYLLADSRHEENKIDHFSDFQNTEAWIGRVISYPEEKPNSWKLIVRMEEAKTTRWKKTSGKVLLYISTSTPAWKYGDRLLIQGAPSPIPAPVNPGEFDYKKYLSFQSIFLRQYLKQTSIVSLPRHESKGFIYYSHVARHWASEVIKKYIYGKQERGICLAIVLGVTDGIDNELRESFAACGAMHILSVSGLHVGVIFVLLLWLLRPFRKSKYYYWINAVVCITALWAFAFVSGLSPSVLRAVTMFSFVSTGRAIRRNVNAFNVLACSAFLLLVFNPFLIMNVGFQFSYLAVLGIFYGHNKLYHTLKFTGWLGNACWEITCLSLTAQAATFLLGLVYFHQFPNYFIAANLTVVPLSTGILIGSIALLAFSPITAVAMILGFLVELCCLIVNTLVVVIEELPFSFTTNIHFTWLEFLFLFLSLFFLILLFETKKWNWVYAFALMIIFFAGARWLYFFREVNPSRLIVYNIPKDEAVQFIDHGKSAFWPEKESKASHFVFSNYTSFGVKHSVTKEQLPMSQQGSVKLFSIEKNKIAWINTTSTFPPVNYLIIGRNAIQQLEELKKVSTCVVLDGSNSFYYTNKVKSFCTLHKIPFHAVTESGAFLLVK